MFLHLRILESGKFSLQSPLLARPPSQWVNKRSPVPSGVERTRLGGASENLGPGLGGFGGSVTFCPAKRGAQRARAEGPGPGPALLQGSAPHDPPRGGGGRRGLPGPPPTALSAAWGRGGGRAPGSQRDGFRNRVAAVSALGQPHPCRPALGSPAAPRSERGAPRWRARSGSPPPAAAGRLDAAAEQVRPWAPSPAARRACPAGRRRTGCWRGGGCPGLRTRWVGGDRGAP